ncbi:DUF3159 domain-containing protein [Isoptericola sp. NEAU-Y5]|uniref:DUF3159 domain-containing protein n=1 Tax=Isoptericola luteus TaxID=2879484 RepID=A0ABS7ZHZ1_9MICO|nr:DUF3159 domain-containing protein [Isoptericola sp. NEAU-Y5]MCA5893916.1 DUF3159 domain-containing protein [Isoptericola sp. NEAU-Y5]
MSAGQQNRGVRAVTADSFSFGEAVGGVRGMVEAIAPGLVFVVVFVVTSDLAPALVASVAAALVAVVARLVQRTPITQALGGLLGIAVGVFWAWRSGEAENFYAVGLWTNAIYLVVILGSILARWPAVGFVVEALRTGFADQAAPKPEEEPAQDAPDAPADADGADRAGGPAGPEGDAEQPNPFAGIVAWRRDRDLLRRYTLATWFWAGLFAVRLAVKVPLYFSGDIGWLGTAHLVLGVPLWGLVLWLTWAVVRGAHHRAPDPAP